MTVSTKREETRAYAMLFLFSCRPTPAPKIKYSKYNQTGYQTKTCLSLNNKKRKNLCSW